MNSDFLILKWSSVEGSLSDEELETLYLLLNKISDEDDTEYCAFPKAYVDGYKEGVKERKKEQENKKELLISKLEELKELEDSDLVRAEVDEALLEYINDKDIERIYDKIKFH